MRRTRATLVFTADVRDFASPLSRLLLALLVVSGPAYSQSIPLDPTEKQANVFVDLDQDLPRVASFLEGGAVVVWQSRGSLGGDDYWESVQSRRISRSGELLDASETQINVLTEGAQLGPDVCSDAEGNYVVVWQSQVSYGPDADGWSVQARRFAFDGRPLDPHEVQVNTITAEDQGGARVACRLDGGYVVAWTDYGEFHADIMLRRFRADGAPLDATERRANTLRSGWRYLGDIAFDPRGRIVAAWESEESLGNDSSETSIQARRFSADGAPVDPFEFQVNTYTPDWQLDPEVSILPDGGFATVWQSWGSLGSDGSEFSIQLRRFATGGNPIDAQDLQVNAWVPASQVDPDVQVTLGGVAVVTWASVGSFGSDVSQSIQLRRIGADGVPLDPAELQANAYVEGNQWGPAVALALDGNATLVWSSFGSFGTDASRSSIQLRRFGRPSIEVTSTSNGTGGPACTLRDAITAANSGASTGGCPAGDGGAVISLPPASTISLEVADNGANGLPTIAKAVTLLGRGARIERDANLGCPGAPEFRILEVQGGGLLALSDIGIGGGCSMSRPGGAILVSGGSVVLDRTLVESSASESRGGGLAILDGALIAFDSYVRDNLAAEDGGGLAVEGSSRSILVIRSTLSGNTATRGGGLFYSSSGAALLRNTTISGNVSSTRGGGVDAWGDKAVVSLEFSTLTENVAPIGSGVHANAGEIALHGTMVGENLGEADCSAGGGSIAATGANLDTDGSCAALAGGGVTSVASLLLGPLSDEGGFAPIHLPEAGSPAVDSAPECATSSGSALLVDQRRFPRPTDDDGDSDPECEIGAAERGPVFLDGFESGDSSRW